MPRPSLFLWVLFFCHAATSGKPPPPGAGLSLTTGLQLQSRPEAVGSRLVLGYEKSFPEWTGFSSLSGYHELPPIFGRIAPLETEYGLAFTAAPLSAFPRRVQFAVGAAVYTGIRRGRLIRSEESSDFGDKEYAATVFLEPGLPMELRIRGGWFELRPFFILAERSRFGLDLGLRIPPKPFRLTEARKQEGGIGLSIDFLSLAKMQESPCEDSECNSFRPWLAIGPEYHHEPWGLSLAAHFAKTLATGPDYVDSHSRGERYYHFYADFLLHKELGGMGLEAGFAKDLSWLSIDEEGGRWMTGGDHYFRWGVYNHVRRFEWGITGFGISRIGLSLGARLFR